MRFASPFGGGSARFATLTFAPPPPKGLGEKRSKLQKAFYTGWRYGSFYPELELVHNLHRLLVYPEFTEYDIYWLNAQARIFFERGKNPVHGFYEPVVECLSELFSLVQGEIKAKLTWQGPRSVRASVPK